MKKLLILMMTLVSSLAFADLTVSTNLKNIPASGIFSGKIDRVIFASGSQVVVFLKNEQDKVIGISFLGDSVLQGATLGSALGCEANIAVQQDGQISFAVNSCAR